MKLPLAGNRDKSAAAYNHQGTLGYYWASSPTGTLGYIVYLSATQVTPAANAHRADGFSVRCVADQVLVTFAPNGAGVNVGFPNKSVIPGSPV